MKKLLDEGPDDFTRALLEAGARQRPPAGSRARLLVALGVGTSFGLLSAKALAWCGTQAGKWTLFGVALCSAGTIYLVLPAPALVPARTPAAVVGAPPRADEALDGVARQPAADALPPDSPTATAPALDSPAPSLGRAPVSADVSPRASAARPRRSPPPATPKTLAAQRAAEVAAERTELDVEVRLVDQLRSATLRRDWVHAQELVDHYRQAFPHGQLEHEVSALASQVSVRSRR
jgi:hypothetical protein